MQRQSRQRASINELLEGARSRIERLEPREALQAQTAGALIVDTRCAELRREQGIIPGSVHVPLSVLFWRLDSTSGYADDRLIDVDRHVILVCADGYSSSLAADTLRELGFARAGDVIGGFSAWAAGGLPVERVPADP
jgi:rhodanese-related sulfurtransferase